MNRKHDIYDRIFNFVVSVIKFTRTIPKTEENKIIITQLLRSATSMGANSEEADGVTSKKDFLHCFTIVRKEGKETSFWLRLIIEINPDIKPSQDLVGECNQIVAIVSKIIQNSRK